MKSQLPTNKHSRLFICYSQYFMIILFFSFIYERIVCSYVQSKVQIAKRHRKHYSFLRTCVPLLFIFSVFLLISLMYWLYFDLREQLSNHRSKIEQGECNQTTFGYQHFVIMIHMRYHFYLRLFLVLTNPQYFYKL